MGAEVYLDGNWIGTANASNHFVIQGLLPGTYQFSFKREGQLIHSCTVPLAAGESVSMPVLPPPPTLPQPVQARPIRKSAPPEVIATPSPAAPRPAAAPPIQAARPAPPLQAAVPPPPAARKAVRPISAVDERLILFPLLAVMLVLGGLLASRFFARQPAPEAESKTAEAASQARTEPPTDAGDQRGGILSSEPDFIEDLRFRESLFQKGFSKPKRISNRDIVVDIDSYEVGKEL